MKISSLDTAFGIAIIIFVLFVSGMLPREFVPWYAALLAVVFLSASLDLSVLLYVRMIPLFIAIPVTSTYDNLNMWRIMAILIFFRWAGLLLNKKFFRERWLRFRSASFWSGIKRFPIALLIAGLFIIAALSALRAPDQAAAMRRILYFANFGFIALPVYWLARFHSGFVRKIISSIALSAVVVIIAGYFQLASTYFIDIYRFIDVWGEGMQRIQFGSVWSEIAVHLGNTWFAYYGDQLSLRVFSLAPDSHSFPLSVLIGIPALFAAAVKNITGNPRIRESLRCLVTTRTSFTILWIVAAFLIIILSGTRGIWAAGVGTVGVIAILMFIARRLRIGTGKKNIIIFTGSYIVLFFLLFSVAFPIFASPQFLLAKGDADLLKNRIRSVIDFGEMSNAQRIEIWRKSIASIGERPFLGVGIGNFPVVLGQDVFLARAGSSAHNLYLHIAAETGLPALFLFLALVAYLYKRLWKTYLLSSDPYLEAYYAAALIYLPWVLLYSLTDVAILDERSLNLFVISAALLAASSHNE